MKFIHRTALYLIFLGKDNIICTFFINATMCTKLIKELNVLHLRNYTKVLPMHKIANQWKPFFIHVLTSMFGWEGWKWRMEKGERQIPLITKKSGWRRGRETISKGESIPIRIVQSWRIRGKFRELGLVQRGKCDERDQIVVWPSSLLPLLFILPLWAKLYKGEV